ncbi:SPW repeat protein [Streptomyces sp. NPDC093250]|uniref:SPW repeat domain-containing protein n=1 Tax=unclassified Streptomyces TaxID=2593676 RepID=UPI0033C9B000
MTTLYKSDTAPSRHLRPERALMRAQRQEIIGLLMIFSSLLLFIAPWIVGYPDSAKDAHRNELGIGLIVLLIAIARFIWYPGKWPDLVVLLAGAWMIASPWALDLQDTAVFDGAEVIDVAVGIMLMALAVLSLLMLWLTERPVTRRQA